MHCEDCPLSRLEHPPVLYRHLLSYPDTLDICLGRAPSRSQEARIHTLSLSLVNGLLIPRLTTQVERYISEPPVDHRGQERHSRTTRFRVDFLSCCCQDARNNRGLVCRVPRTGGSKSLQWRIHHSQLRRELDRRRFHPGAAQQTDFTQGQIQPVRIIHKTNP